MITENLSTLRLSKEKREQYASLLLLDQMINNGHRFIVGQYSDYINPLLIKMDAAGYISLDDVTYTATDKGRESLQVFVNRYAEFLKVFDIYCAVDLVSGEFAFCKEMFEMNSIEWEQHVEDERFEDVRMAACKLKDYDPLEAGFMIFLEKGRFDLSSNTWEFDLVNDLIWDELETIVQESKDFDHLDYEDEDGNKVEGSSVIEDVVRQGSKLMIDLLKEEKRLDEEASNAQDEEDEEECEEEMIVETTIIEEYHDVDYYDPYYNDPFYMSPLFIGAMILL